MHKVDIAGLQVNAVTKQQLLDHVAQRTRSKQKTFVTTVYSEFLYQSMRDNEIRTLLNKADIAVADGIGVLWAQTFLARPFTVGNFYLKIIQAWWQVVITGATILLHPKAMYKVFPEKIVGASLIWDLAALAEKHNFSIFLLGGFNDTPARVAGKLQQTYPRLQIAGHSNGSPQDPEVLKEIEKANPDMILVAFGPITQERWIVQHLPNLPASFAIGLGGTFDYIVGIRSAPPAFIRAIGLEWLYRLFTQPHRIKRIYQAVWGLILSLVRYKVFDTYPYRRNGVAIVVNKENKILLCKRAFAIFDKFTEDYWQFPQGGLEEQEREVEGTMRELKEETGMHSVEVLGVANYQHAYKWNNGGRPLFRSRYRHKGQKQQTVFFRFTGSEHEIHLDQHELVEYRWCSVEEVLHTIAPERYNHAQAVLEELKALLDKTLKN